MAAQQVEHSVAVGNGRQRESLGEIAAEHEIQIGVIEERSLVHDPALGMSKDGACYLEPFLVKVTQELSGFEFKAWPP